MFGAVRASPEAPALPRPPSAHARRALFNKLVGFMTNQIHNTKYLLALGFALVLTLMAALVVIGLTHAKTLNERMGVIVNEYSTKADLVATMRSVARDRSVSLHRMAVMSDPFERDEEYLKFRQAAWDFLQARDALAGMALTAKEQEVFSASQELTVEATKYQEKVYELIGSGKQAEANELLLTKAVPAQDRVFERFSQFLELQQTAKRNAVASADEEYRRAMRVVLALGLLAMGSGIGIAVYVVRRSVYAEQALFREKERAEVTLFSIGDAVISVSAEGLVEYLNPVAEQLTGWSRLTAQGRPLVEVFRVVNENTRQNVPSPAIESILDGQAVSADPNGVLISHDGKEYAIEQSASPMRDPSGAVIGMVLVFRDVTQSRHLARQLSWQATHDALTGLGNRIEFEAMMDQMLETARNQGKQHALIYLDLDRFKIVNDTCGHVAGDELLRQLSLMLTGRVREGDGLFRLGGDEFAILLAGCAVDRAHGIANDIRQGIEEFRFGWDGKTFSVGASMGLVPISADSRGKQQILAAADAACYAAKEKGRNRVQIYQPGDSELAAREGEMQWLQRINAAIGEDRFVLYHQKLLNTRDSSRTIYEILLRMRDEQGNIVPPQAFIPAAERYHLMPSIDRWVVAHTLSWARANRGTLQGLEAVFINLSGQSLNDEKFLAFVVEQLEQYSELIDKIGFEITETAAIANLARAVRFISMLKAMGCHFALDDFGSGMSSFAYLKNLKVDKVKIDGIFVRDMLVDEIDFAMVESINRIGQLMGIETVAEFVENEEILAGVRELGVDFAQGYGIHRPEPLVSASTIAPRPSVARL